MMAKKGMQYLPKQEGRDREEKGVNQGIKRNQIKLKLKTETQKTPNIPKIPPHHQEFCYKLSFCQIHCVDQGHLPV